MINIYELCAMIGIICFVLITVFLIRFLIKASKMVDEMHETNKQINEVVKETVSLVNPLLKSVKDAKKILEQLKKLIDVIKGKKEYIQGKVEDKKRNKKTK